MFGSPYGGIVLWHVSFGKFLLGATGAPMECFECGPFGLSSLLRFRVFSLKFLQLTLPMVGWGWDKKFLGGGGFDPLTPKNFW